MFRKFWLDVILATAFIFGVMGLFASATAFKIFDVFDPIGEAFSDMEVTDVVFSQLRDEPVADDRIVLVNMGTLSRGEIGMMLQIIGKYNPAVIGIDSFFYFPKEDTLGDQMLMEGLAGIENLVLASKIIFQDAEDASMDSMAYSWEAFNQFAASTAYANLVTDAQEQADLKMCRTFVPKQDVRGEERYAFGVELAKYYDEEKAEKFLQRNYLEEVINYRGNVLDYGATKFGTTYFALDIPDVFNENFVPEMIEGKIVMFCYLGKYLGDRESLEDKYYTPLNQTYIGRAFPDMYGGVIHANIISMILNEDYIDSMGEEQGIVLGIFLCLLNVALFSWVYRRLPKWYDGITKLFQLVEIAALTFLMIYVLDYASFKLNLGLGVVAVALAGDSLEVYFGVVKNAFTKEGRRSLFKMDKL
ncbi:CHASE2 domain-containing protein [Marinoscillum sp. MHG1-6]|uniref:CHASE2 domain-containing protein n=1 Tax=Marinoscillum sp. MHG1-6 TaxID=2959627 RepID=UPI0021578296|nr:CHASE2 domain-containing protein [Marinoscillum sp. MHG1-6]